jgi:hypothetical protein
LTKCCVFEEGISLERIDAWEKQSMTQISEAMVVVLTVAVLTLAIGQFGGGIEDRAPASIAQTTEIGSRAFNLDPSKPALEIRIRPLYMSSPDTGTIEKYLVDARKIGILEHYTLEQEEANGEEIYCAEISSEQVKPGVFADLQKLHTDILITDYEVTSVRSCRTQTTVHPVAGL